MALLGVGCKKMSTGPLTAQEQAVAGKWVSSSDVKGVPRDLAKMFKGASKFELMADRNFVYKELFEIKGKWMLSGDTLIFAPETVDGLTSAGIEEARKNLDKQPATGELFGNTNSPYQTLRMQEETLSSFGSKRFKLSQDGTTFQGDKDDSGIIQISEKFVRDTTPANSVTATKQ